MLYRPRGFYRVHMLHDGGADITEDNGRQRRIDDGRNGKTAGLEDLQCFEFTAHQACAIERRRWAHESVGKQLCEKGLQLYPPGWRFRALALDPHGCCGKLEFLHAALAFKQSPHQGCDIAIFEMDVETLRLFRLACGNQHFPPPMEPADREPDAPPFWQPRRKSVPRLCRNCREFQKTKTRAGEPARVSNEQQIVRAVITLQRFQTRWPYQHP